MSFEIGDKVYSLRFGEGEVINIIKGMSNPVIVTFPLGNFLYTRKGFLSKSDGTQDLYHGKPEIIEPPAPSRMASLTVDTKILVRDYEDAPWLKRYYKESANGKPRCFPNGQDSWSSDGGYCEWNYWKLPEEDDLLAY